MLFNTQRIWIWEEVKQIELLLWGMSLNFVFRCCISMILYHARFIQSIHEVTYLVVCLQLSIYFTHIYPLNNGWKFGILMTFSPPRPLIKQWLNMEIFECTTLIDWQSVSAQPGENGRKISWFAKMQFKNWIFIIFHANREITKSGSDCYVWYVYAVNICRH